MKHIATFLITALLATAGVEAKPLKVFILAGQSNMEGPAKIETFDYIGDDPATAPLLKMMRGPDGKPTVCEGVWISYLTGAKDNNFDLSGKLTAGYGSLFGQDPTKPGDKIGPEFTFGLTMDAALDEPFLIIKTAWGGKSLHTDFRPPSAGAYEFSEGQLAELKKQGKDVEQAKADKVKATGHYYRLMIEHVKKVLADPKRVVPDYDPNQGYEIAGFAWLQGFNDMVDGGTYPNRNQAGGYAKYSEWMADFIRDVRKDLNAPKMPFVIGVIGVGGHKANGGAANLRPAMAAPAEMPEFKGNVFAVQTAPFWDQPLADIEEKIAKIKGSRYHLGKNAPNNVRRDPVAAAILDKYIGKDGTITKAQTEAFAKEYRAKLITADEEALWKRGASNAGYHYLGCAKTFALMGKAFAEANLQMLRQWNNQGF